MSTAVVVTAASAPAGGGGNATATVTCPLNTRALGGGATVAGGGPGQVLTSSAPTLSGDVATGWTVSYRGLNNGGIATAYAICGS